MRIFLKALTIAFAGCVLAIAFTLGWFFFYSRDLPDIESLERFAPRIATTVSDACSGRTSIAIPYDAIGSNLRAALNAAEGGEEGPSPTGEVMHAFGDVRDGRTALSSQIARTMFCDTEKALMRQVREMRLAAQLERHFSRQELFTIAANRYYFGDAGIGVQAAAQYFFHKNPADLSVAESALLAGLVRAPSYLSPLKHPDRALRRRNDVIDAMVKEGRITAADGEAAKAKEVEQVERLPSQND